MNFFFAQLHLSFAFAIVGVKCGHQLFEQMPEEIDCTK
jgi:hypothetical protein